MVTENELLSSFEIINVIPSTEVLTKCIETCTYYNLDAEDFVDQWTAFMVSQNLSPCPTIENLVKMERKEFKSKSKTNAQKNAIIPKDNYETNECDDMNYDNNNRSDNWKTPVQMVQKTDPALENNNQTPTVEDNSIEKYSGQSYSERKNARCVQTFFGLQNSNYKRQNDLEVNVSNHLENVMLPSATYMYETIRYKMEVLDYIIDWIGECILKNKNFSDTKISKTETTGGVMTTFGRICSDADGRLNLQSILLEGSQKTSHGCTVPLNLSKLSRFSLFPGQVVALKGIGLANRFIVNEIFWDGSLKLSPVAPSITDPLQMVVACGPFTLQNSLQYEPLHDLIKYANEYKPHILILMGPFIDESNNSLENLDMTFDEFFEKTIATVATSIPTDVQLIVVSSAKEAHHHCVYPTPPYKTREDHKNIIFMPDPCMININGIVVGATTPDVLCHLGKEEMFLEKSASGFGDRFGRLASHILQQQSFYPLYPPDKEMSIDHDLLVQYGMMNCMPHILILPSNFRKFIKKIEDCLVVNPERLTKGFIGGSFARFEVLPGSSNSICDRVSCQVLSI